MENEPKRNRGGRPRTREPQPGRRITISVRVTPRLKALLDGAVETSGRSVSQEAEFRLEQTFSRIVEAVGTATLRPTTLEATGVNEAGETQAEMSARVEREFQQWQEKMLKLQAQTERDLALLNDVMRRVQALEKAGVKVLVDPPPEKKE